MCDDDKITAHIHTGPYVWHELCDFRNASIMMLAEPMMIELELQNLTAGAAPAVIVTPGKFPGVLCPCLGVQVSTSNNCEDI